MEVWNDGIMGSRKKNLSWVIQVPFPTFHYSSIPYVW
jgi:hypothetical protein